MPYDVTHSNQPIYHTFQLIVVSGYGRGLKSMTIQLVMIVSRMIIMIRLWENGGCVRVLHTMYQSNTEVE